MSRETEVLENSLTSSDPSGADESELLLASDGCPNCGEPGEDTESSWCRKCGWYGKLGTTIELDEEGKAQEDGEAAAVLPAWAYKLAGIWFGLLAVSFVARLSLGGWPAAHAVFGLVQLVGGCGLFLSLHLASFVQRSLADGGLKLMDLLGPFAIWGPVFHELPKTERRVLLAWTGLWAGVFAAAVTGGIPTSWLEFQATVIDKQEQGVGGGRGGASDGSGLTDSMEDFAEQGTRMLDDTGSQGLGEAAGQGDEQSADEELADERLEEMDCLILGYLPGMTSSEATAATADDDPTNTSSGDSAGDATPKPSSIRALVVASEVHGRLCVVGYVSAGVTGETADGLLQRFAGHTRETPLAPCAAPAVWLQPRFIARVRYKQWDAASGLVDPEFDEIIQEVGR